MPPVGFEPTISAGERPQTYTLDRAATGSGTITTTTTTTTTTNNNNNNKQYTHRHSNCPSYIHWTIYKHKELQVTDMYYERIPEEVFNVNGTTVMWGVPIITDRTITNQPT